MAELRREVMERKLALQEQFLRDLEAYAALDPPARRREHYAIERLLQLLCETAADVALQVLKSRDYGIAGSYREVFESLAPRFGLPVPAAAGVGSGSHIVRCSSGRRCSSVRVFSTSFASSQARRACPMP